MKLTKIASALALAVAFTGVAYAATPKAVNVKIVAFNDFHGQLESPGTFRNQPASSTPSTPVGGVDWMAGYIADIKSKNANTVVVSAGDLIGATPLISALFHDEPSIEAMNMLGLDINAVGNHEFDEGKAELLRMQNGGCHPTDLNSCQGAVVGTPVPFEGAKFKFLAANVFEKSTGKNIFPAYELKEFDGLKVAFIGMTLKETPTIVTPSGVAGLRFMDEANAVNILIRSLYEQGVRAFVVLIHQGGTVPTTQAVSTINNCDEGLNGATSSRIKSIVSRLSNAVDLVITGHTHQAYNCKLATQNPAHLIPVTSANSQGRVLTNIDMVMNKNGDVTSINANNIVVDRTNTNITPNAAIQNLVAGYKSLATPIGNRVIGNITATLSRTPNTAGENVMGDIIADSQLAATAAPKFGGAQVAFMNPGGVRAEMAFTSSTAGEGDGIVTYSEAFTVQPFGNSLVTMTVTGEQIEKLLEQQFTGCPNDLGLTQPFNRILLPSAGFSYSWSATGPACDKINPASIMLNGAPIVATDSYRITVNNFLATGGDNFSVLTKGTKLLGGAQDLDALEAYFTASATIAPVTLDRITLLP